MASGALVWLDLTAASTMTTLLMLVRTSLCGIAPVRSALTNSARLPGA
jgi:hypothetical protein